MRGEVTALDSGVKLSKNPCTVSQRWSPSPRVIGGNQRGCAGRGRKPGSCLRSAPSAPCPKTVCVCVRGHLSALSSWLWTSVPMSLSKLLVNTLVLSAYWQATGNIFQNFINLLCEKMYTYLLSTSKISSFL